MLREKSFGPTGASAYGDGHVIILVDGPRLRELVARACRVLADRGLVEGVLGHVSARVGEGEMVVRCRGAEERGLAASTAQDIWRMTLDGTPVDLPEGYAPPKELPLHGELLRARPDVGAVVHAHPRSALLCGLAGLKPRAVFGAYDSPAMRLAFLIFLNDSSSRICLVVTISSRPDKK